MEWIEVAESDVETAKSTALEKLGVREQEAEFEILSEGKTGLFGRVKQEARVRARVKPRSQRSPRSRQQRGGRGNRRGQSGDQRKSSRSGAREGRSGDRSGGKSGDRSGGGSGGRSGSGRSGSGRSSERPGDRSGDRSDGRADRADSKSNSRTHTKPNQGKETAMESEQDQITLDELGEIVTPCLEGLLQSLGKEGEVKLEQNNGLVEVRVIGEDLGLLIGPRGAVLSSLYDVLSTVIQSEIMGRRYPRIRLDVGDYRKKRREALADFTRNVSGEAKDTGKEIVLEAMNAGDRKIVHDTAAEIDGIETQSEGEEPYRKVVIIPVD